MSVIELNGWKGRPTRPDFAVVTATTRPTPLARACVESWRDTASYQWTTYEVQQVYGVVPAFAVGVHAALKGGAQVIACFHDDLRIDELGWDARVLAVFEDRPKCGLAGFGGALGLGDPDIYQSPYRPQQLARRGFLSNMEHAEAHGQRTRLTQRAVCFDGFSQIGRAGFWQGTAVRAHDDDLTLSVDVLPYMEQKGALHHAYDSWLGAIAARLGWESWLIPVACHHYGGQTAVGDPAYQKWAHQYGGDQTIWERAHQAMYDDCRGVLPLRVGA